MKIDVIFSSYNGADTLPLMLDAMCDVEVPDDVQLRIIAVNNNSQDATIGILDAYRSRLPLDTLEQPRPGKNCALNLALETSDADLLVFTDDDIIPDPGWIVEYSRAFREYPNTALFGGAIQPYWMQRPPEELIASIPIGAAYAITPDNLREGPCKAGAIWGPNMAVRRDVFHDGIRFNEDIGPRGGNYPMGSETEFLNRCEDRGHNAVFLPRAVVQHIILAQQISKRWVAGRAFRYGRGGFHSKLRQAPERTLAVPTLLGYPRWMLRQYIQYTFRSLRPSYSSIWNQQFYRGYMNEFRNHVQKKRAE